MAELNKDQISSDLIGVVVTGTEYQDVDISTIASPDEERNPRDAYSAYNVKTNKDMQELVEDMKVAGWQHGSVITLHRNTMKYQGNTLLQIVRGHRRYYAAKEANIRVVPCNIYTGLTNKQIYNMLVEQKGVDYGPIGDQKAVIRLYVEEHMGQKRIAKRLKITENLVQDYRTLGTLPQKEFNAWIEQKRGGDKDVPFNINSAAIRALGSALLRDQNGKTIDPVTKDSVDSGRPKCTSPNGGVEYAAKYVELCAGIKSTPKVSASEMKTLAQMEKEPTVKDMFFAFSEGSAERGVKINVVADKCSKLDNLQALGVSQPQLAALLSSVAKPLGENGLCDSPRLVRIAAWIVEACNFKISVHPDTDPLIELPSKTESIVPSYEGALPPEEVIPDSPEAVVTEPEPEPEPEVTLTKAQKRALARSQK